jgi:hypothetical protein
MQKLRACRKRRSSTQPFSSTRMRCMTAICAAGPPNERSATRTQARVASPKPGPAAGRPRASLGRAAVTIAQHRHRHRAHLRRPAVFVQVDALPGAEARASLGHGDGDAPSGSVPSGCGRACRPGPPHRARSRVAVRREPGRKRSRSRRTAGSAFSQIISEALVCCTKTCASPVRMPDTRTAAWTAAGDVHRARPGCAPGVAIA